MRVCVLIPTYNESKAIGRLVSQVKENRLDVLVIDDGSRDDTAHIARQNGAFVISHKKNMGKGASLKSGFAHAIEKKYDAIVVMDGDGQHNPADITRFIQTARSTDADLIIGNRMHDPKTMPFVRWLMNRCLSSFISRFSGMKIPDTQCGFRFIKRKTIEKIGLISSKYEIESEMLIRALRNKFKVLSIPIKSIYNGEVSTIHPIKDAYRFVRLILKMKSERRRAKK